MTTHLFAKTTLALASVIALIVGAGSLIDPVAFNAGVGVTVGPDAGLVNELRSGGGAILAIGILAATGVVVKELRHTALICAFLGFGGYGFGRVFDFLAAGIPNQSLVWVAALEIVVSLACLTAITVPKLRPARF